jgi:hypothetical protein
MSNSISFDDMRERVGRAFYGDAWIDKTPDREWQLIQRYGPERAPRPDGARRASWDEIVRPCPPGLTKDLAIALGLHRIACAQLGTADEWLRLYGFDISQSPFIREDFETVLAGPLGKAIAQLRAELIPAAAVVTDLTASMTRAALEQKYREHADAYYKEKSRWPSIEIDETWAKTNGMTRERMWELRRQFREGPEFAESKKGGRPSVEPLEPSE